MRYLGRRLALGDWILRPARAVGRTMRELGPYVAIALVLPGGSVIALAAWIFRHRRPITVPSGRMLVMVAAVGAALLRPGSV